MRGDFARITARIAGPAVLLAVQTACIGLTLYNNDPAAWYACSIQGAGDADGDGVCDPDDVCSGADDWVDADADGTADDCDACPLDVLDDSDNDGWCDSDDLCPEFDDAIDEDVDGFPDGCDACPDDPVNDQDGDGICDAVDPCPGTSTNDCDHQVMVGIDGQGEVLESGGFTAMGESYLWSYDLKDGETVCVSLDDTFGDGGVAGFIFDEATTHTITQWTHDEWTDTVEYCGVVANDVGTAEPMPELFGSFPDCQLQVHLRTDNWGGEVAWQLEDSKGYRLAGADVGSYGNNTDYYIDVDMTLGAYTFVMFDDYGDGWHNGYFEVIDPTPVTGLTYASGTLSSGSYGTVEFTINGC